MCQCRSTKSIAQTKCRIRQRQRRGTIGIHLPNTNRIKSKTLRRNRHPRISQSRLGYKPRHPHRHQNQRKKKNARHERGHARMPQPKKEKYRPHDNTPHRRPIRQQLIRIIHSIIAAHRLAPHIPQMRARHPHTQRRKYKKSPHRLPTHCSTAAGTPDIRHPYRISQTVKNTGLHNTQRVKKPQTEQHIEIGKKREPQHKKIQLDRNTRKPAPKWQSPSVHQRNRWKCVPKIAHDIPHHHNHGNCQSNPEQARMQKPVFSCLNLLQHRQRHFRQGKRQALSIHPLPPQHSHQRHAHQRQCNEKNTPPHKRRHPRIPGNINPRGLALKKIRHLLCLIGRRGPLWQSIQQIIAPLILGRGIIIRRGNAPNEQTHKIRRRHSPCNPPHRKNHHHLALRQRPSRL